jgi:osmotically-inducible protein OsmY
MMMRSTTLLVALCAGVMALGGCVPLMFGGAVTSAMVASDRRTSGTVLEDNGIQIKANARINENLGDRAHINITSYNRQVLITGEAPTQQDKELVEKVVSNVENVRNIVNDVAVMGKSTLTQRSSDVLVSSRVKASLVDAPDMFTNAFKIITERGTTYLMGRVTQREANRATEIITATSGVQKLVRVLEIISEEELARMPSQQNTEASKPAPGK